MISANTVGVGIHEAGAPGTIAGTTGDYETFLANGRVFALGSAMNEHDSQIVQDDLARIAGEIAG